MTFELSPKDQTETLEVNGAGERFEEGVWGQVRISTYKGEIYISSQDIIQATIDIFLVFQKGVWLFPVVSIDI